MSLLPYFVCPSDPASSFLPLGLAQRRPPHALALIDTEAAPRVANLRWTVSNSGHVSRKFYDALNSRIEGREVVATEALALKIRRVATRVPFSFESGDLLDFRTGNLVLRPSNPDGTRWATAGQTVRAHPDFLLASSWLALQAPALRAALPSGRRTRLSADQIRAFLDSLLADPDKARRPIAALTEELSAELGESSSVFPSHVARVIRGKAQPIAGFDYTKLATLRPTRSEIAARRAAARTAS